MNRTNFYIIIRIPPKDYILPITLDWNEFNWIEKISNRC